MTTTRVPGLGGIWQSEHDFRDKHASQFTTGRFVLLPKNLVTGAPKAGIVVVRPGALRRVGLYWQLKPRSIGAFFATRSLTEKRVPPRRAYVLSVAILGSVGHR